MRSILLLFLLLSSLHADERPLVDFTYHGSVVRVKDGDTIVAHVELGFDLWKHDEVMRLLHVFAPESFRPKSIKERTDGAKVKQFLIDRLLPGEDITITTEKDKKDMYGRSLVIIWDEDGNVNESILEYMKNEKIKSNEK